MAGNKLLSVKELRVEFVKRSLLRPTRTVQAVSDVSFDLDASETLGLVGESGSGKSTSARAVLHLVKPAGGTISWKGEDITNPGAARLQRLRREMQIVFQDPNASLDPAQITADVVAEPLRVHDWIGLKERHERAGELLERVGLARHHLHRYPYEFSGGQRQRIAIARAIALNPSFIACDEVVSALDVSVQGQVLNLLLDLQYDLGVSYLFITHNLAVVRQVSRRIAVMYLGRIVEIGPSDRVYSAPSHPYTQALLSAIPDPRPVSDRRGNRIVLSGELPDPANPPPGCRFHTRCTYAMEVCRSVTPKLTPVDGGGEVACHLQTDGPRLEGRPLSALSARSLA
jgi:peptide/nickel transport system ATP-binding protein